MAITFLTISVQYIWLVLARPESDRGRAVDNRPSENDRHSEPTIAYLVIRQSLQAPAILQILETYRNGNYELLPTWLVTIRLGSPLRALQALLDRIETGRLDKKTDAGIEVV